MEKMASDKKRSHQSISLSVKSPTELVPQLTFQLADICSNVKISDQEFSDLTNLMGRILKIAQKRNSRVEVATLFRHNYLKLRNAGSNQLLFYLSDLQYQPLFMQYPEIEKLFQGSELKPLPPKSLREVEAGFPFLDSQTGRIVGVVTHSEHQAEVVCCQLAKHLLEFDPRAKTFITLVHYWARENEATLQEKKIFRKTTSNMPDPAALEWFCLFFLCREGVIPSLKELRSHHVKGRRDAFIEGGHQLSFPKDHEFVKEWKAMRKLKTCAVEEGSKGYVLELLHLAQRFFSFCSGRDIKGQVLNTTNGELIPLLSAIEEGLIDPSLDANKYTADKSSFEVMRKKALALGTQLEKEVYLMQPFLNRRFDICQGQFDKHVHPLMEKTSSKLEFYLGNLPKSKEARDVEVDLTSLLKCGNGGMEIIYGTLERSEETDSEEDIVEEPEIQPQMDVDVGTNTLTPTLQLSDQFPAVRDEISISDDEFQMFTDLLGRIQRIVGERNSSIKFTTLFRHNYLKLRNGSSNQLLIYLSELNHQPFFMLHPEKEVESLFEGSELKPLRGDVLEAGFPYMDTKTGLHFGLVTHLDHQAEVVFCQLVRHLQLFDPRVRSLLILLHFWARENEVTLSKAEENSLTTDIPDPSALEWLCIFFLSGEKVIPTLQQLRNNANGKARVLIEGRPLEVSFPKDFKFIGDWRALNLKKIPMEGSNQYVLNVMQLAHGFFTYYSTNDLRGKVLNTKDGRVLTLSSAMKEGLLSKSDAVDVQEMEGEIHLMQPFLNRRFAISQEKFQKRVCPLMEMTARKLAFFLENVKTTTGDKIPEADLRSLFRCGKVADSNEKTRKNVDRKAVDGAKRQSIPASKEIEKERQVPTRLVSSDVDPHDGGASISMETETYWTFLPHQFKALHQEVSLPSEELQGHSEIQQKLVSFFTSHGFQDCQVVPFRSFYLDGKKFGSETEMIFFVDHAGLYSGADVTNEVPDVEFQRDFVEKVENNGDYSDLTKRLLLATVKEVSVSPKGTQLDIPLLSFDQWSFRIATRSFLPEVQACRLVEYYCTLDPRVKPLMTIVIYWAKINNIQIGKDDDDPFKYIVGVAPASALFEWLVIFFLCQKKILPPPSEISGGKSTESKLLFDGVKIGFKNDPEYAREWWNRYKETNEEHHMLNVFVLAQEFFRFWKEFGFKAMLQPTIIDMKNGNFIEKQEVYENLDNIRRLCWVTGISYTDWMLLNSELKISEGLYSRDEAVTILHPLHIKYSFSFSWESFISTVCSKMAVSEKKLKTMLESVKSNADRSVMSSNLFTNAVFKI